MIVFRYSGEGFVPAVIADPKPLEDVSAITFLGASSSRSTRSSRSGRWAPRRQDRPGHV